MKKMLNRMAGFALVLLCLMLPMRACAAEAASGICGANLTWTLDEAGLLTISGTGVMKNFSSQAPWGSEVKKVVIEDGVTSIGDSAFEGCSSLTSIDLPDGVTSIGYSAFEGCSSLTSIDLPDGVTSIYPYTFYGCSSLTSIDLPEGVTSIGVYAFRDCSNLTSIHIPEGVTSIGNAAFRSCSKLTSIDIPDGVTSIGKSAFEGCSSLTSIDLPDGVTSIGEWAFCNCSSLTSIDLPDGVTSIGARTFSGCSKLTSIDLPDGVTSIGEDAFSYCRSLTSIDLPDGVTSIGEDAFYGCSKLTSIDLPDSVTSIGSGAFADCSSLTSIHLPDGVTSIGRSAFIYCSSLTSIDLPDGVTSIGDSAFFGCSSLTSIDLPDGVTSIGEDAFFECSSLTSIDLPDGVTSIGDSAFIDCSSLTSIDLPDGVTSIGYAAFYGCSSLTSIDLPDGVTSIGERAFSSCSSLTSIDLPDGVTTIGEEAFYDCSSLTSIDLPDGVKSIGNYAFAWCNIIGVGIPASVTSIGNMAFYSYSLKRVAFYGESMPTLRKDVFGGNHLIIYCYEGSDVDLWAFREDYATVYFDRNNPNIALEISLPDSLTLWAGDTHQVTAAVFPVVDASELTWTSSDTAVAAIDSTGKVTALKCGTTVITVRSGEASAQMVLTVKQPIKSFGLSATELWMFSEETVQLSVKDITPSDAEYSGFQWSSSDEAICTVSSDGLVKALRSGTATITVTCNGVSQTCVVQVNAPVTAVEFIHVPNLYEGYACPLTVQVTVGERVFENKLVTFTSSDEAVVTVDQQGIVYAKGRGSVTITATAANGVSDSCTLTVKTPVRAVLPKDLVTIEAEAFAGTSAACYVLPDGMTDIGSRAFGDCANLVRIEIPASVTGIADNAFEGCSGLIIIAPEGSTAHEFAVDHKIIWMAE